MGQKLFDDDQNCKNKFCQTISSLMDNNPMIIKLTGIEQFHIPYWYKVSNLQYHEKVNVLQ